MQTIMTIQTFKYLILLKDSPKAIAGFDSPGHVVQFLKSNSKNAKNYTIIAQDGGNPIYTTPEQMLMSYTDLYL